MPTLQIIVGTYEKVLHGLTAAFDPQIATVQFADTFLLNAHGSAIRCLAISPLFLSASSPEQPRVILASGSSDERVNVFQISALPPELQGQPINPAPSLTGKSAKESPRNRELGSLLHHNSSVNALYFATRSKLLSAADDNTLAIIRTRDWTVLSSIKAPIPKASGRPSGDTAPLGGTPAGINDFAVHPSMKLMVSVGKGEKCMRLWNLVTGKKAGVLNFHKDLLHGVSEGRWTSGEGRKVEWNGLGEEFAVTFDKGVVVFGLDSKPKAKIVPHPSTKVHQTHYAEISGSSKVKTEVLALSTEDGRILFYSSVDRAKDCGQKSGIKSKVPSLQALGQLGGPKQDQAGRIKDFEILSLQGAKDSHNDTIVVSGGSDGLIRIWKLNNSFLFANEAAITPNLNSEHGQSTVICGLDKTDKEALSHQLEIPTVGDVVGSYDTGSRMTCLRAFVMWSPGPNGKGNQDPGGASQEEVELDQADLHNHPSRS